MLRNRLPPSLLVLTISVAGGSEGCRVATSPPALHEAPTAQVSEDWAAYVDPTIGTGGHGHTYPGASVPFGMVQLSPDTRIEGWDGCSGYHRSDSIILGFSHTHLSGTGCADLGDVLLMPTTGSIEVSPGTADTNGRGYRSRFSHADESASPGDYRVKLIDSGVYVELTATERAGFHRYTFPPTREANVVVDLHHGIEDKPTDTSISIEGDSTITGYRRSTGWAVDQIVYFVAKFDRPFASFGTGEGGSLAMGQRVASSKDGVKAAVRFDARDGSQVLAKVGISAVDLEGARKNLDAEIHGWDFDAVRTAARRSWNESLGRIAVLDADARTRRIFMTALYHTMLAPTIYSDVDGRFRGSDLAVHGPAGFVYSSTFSLWDTFRAAHPLYTMIVPERVPDMVRSLLTQAQYDPQRRDPIWPLGSWETSTMPAQHSIPVVVEAMNKGLLRGMDASAAYETLSRGANRYGDWRTAGFLSADHYAESASTTLELGYDDWALSRMALSVGRAADCEAYAASAQAYKRLFDTDTKFFRPRLANGAFLDPFDPRALSRPNADGKQVRDFTEGNAWQYLWFVPHDVPGLIGLLGGRAAFTEKLDALFASGSEMTGEVISDVTGLIGQYAHGNEPSHHIAYLYSYAGQPWKTQARVRQILETLYADAPDGLSGNEDCGQMSAWYVLSALGMYPVSPPDGIYVLSAPIVARAVLHAGKKPLVIVANASPENRYIEDVQLNGSHLARPWIRYAEIVEGGTLQFVLGTNPNEDWGAAPNLAPPSGLLSCVPGP